eukprot:86441-Alexandrium_andersonii.AAC.1
MEQQRRLPTLHCHRVVSPASSSCKHRGPSQSRPRRIPGTRAQPRQQWREAHPPTRARMSETGAHRMVPWEGYHELFSPSG